MTLLERYRNGDFQKVHNDIRLLGRDAFRPANIDQVHPVLDETFRRVRHNVELVHRHLRDTGYRFLADSYDEGSKPFTPPHPDTEAQLAELARRVAPSHIPLSLQYFYRHIGSVDFSWDWESVPEIPWTGADPLVIAPLPVLLEELDLYSGDHELWIAPDDLVKDNVSGDAYYLSLYPYPVVDGNISGHNLPLVEYLRRTFENGGFSRADEYDYPGLQELIDTIRPQLLPF
ncbi:hypothetical protein [Flaviaesturariibacter amylovorans]|uniref:Uncharacterized protein n=1 Tax=Flaviaesturariibacter amylovorans TaxID=1084520 RepID=A0ABP8H2U4_9BACT